MTKPAKTKNNHGRKIKSKEERLILVEELLKCQDHLRWDDPLTMRAFVVAKELKEWIERTVVDRPLVSVVVAEPIVSVHIGDCVVWNNESDNIDELNFEYCKEVFREDVLKLAAVFEL